MASGAGQRIAGIDLARGMALAAMAIYHFTWDLEFFGYAAPGLTAEGGWKLFARCIASTFLFLVGFSLVLAHGDGIRWRSFWKRWLTVAASAAAITAATRVAFPDGFIFFGILHQIAAASLLGLAFLRLPPWVTLAVAAAVVAAPHMLRSTVFDAPWLWWVGLSAAIPHSNDYVPVFPWFGAVLIGIAAARLTQYGGWRERLAAIGAPRWLAPLLLAGRHSLLVYLVHQPLLLAALYIFALGFPAQRPPPQEQFLAECSRTCLPLRDAPFCERYCACFLDTLTVSDRLDEVLAGSQNDSLGSLLRQTAEQCTWEAETAGEERERP